MRGTMFYPRYARPRPHVAHGTRVGFCAHAWYTASARQAMARVRVRVGSFYLMWKAIYRK